MTVDVSDLGSAQLLEWGARIAARRRLLGWDQSFLATRAGVGQHAVSKLETGEGARVSADALLRVVQVLGLDVESPAQPSGTTFTRKPSAFTVPRRLRRSAGDPG